MCRIHEIKGIDYGIQILITTYELHNPWNQKKKKKRKTQSRHTGALAERNIVQLFRATISKKKKGGNEISPNGN